MNSLDALDWNTVTRAQARRLQIVAERRYKALCEPYNRGEVSTEVFLAASHLEEDLHVFAVCGVKPAA